MRTFTILSAFLISLLANALSVGDYYIYNDFYQKALTSSEGNPRLAAIDDEGSAFLFEAVNASGEYVMLRHKQTGKYLTASTSNQWSVLLSAEGAGDEYYWKLDQLFSTTIVSKKNTGSRLGCDFKSGSNYYWEAENVPVYYNKGVSAMNWFSIIPSDGNGYKSSLKAAKTASFTNEYGVKEQDAYCVTENVTVSGLDYHIISSVPFDGGTVNLSGSSAWLVFENVRPSAVKSSWLQNVKINGSSAVDGSNCRVEIYLRGAVVIPLSGKPFTASTDGGSFSLDLGNNKDLGEYNNKARSFTLKRGFMATVATGLNGEGYSRVYVADHSDINISLPKALDQRISSVNIRNWHYTSKSGYAGSGDRSYATVRCGSSWYWNWDAGQGSTDDVEYIPIKQHLYWPGDGSFYKQNSTAMMLFNEPEHSEQHTSSKCSCGGTISAWKAYENTGKFNATGLRIGSPSATDLSYIKEFDKNCDNMAQRCDFNCTHGYWTTEWANNLNTLKGYGKPIWITEWEWGASWTSGSNPSNKDDARDKVLSILDMLEYNDYVERYSYYEWDTGGSNGWMRELFWENNASKGLAYVGEIYARVKPHLGYNASIQPVPNWWTPSVSKPEIKNVYLANGKYSLSLGNPNGDATSSITIKVKNGGSWETLTTITDRSLFDPTTINIDVDPSKLGSSFTLKAEVNTIYSTSSESDEYGKTMAELSDDPLSDLKNLSFDEGGFIKNAIITYKKDITGTQVSGEQPVDGWTMNDPGGDAHASGMIEWGAKNTVVDELIAATDKDGSSRGGALAIVACWTSTTQYTQPVIFPAGKYTLTIPVYNAAGTEAISKNLIGFIEDSGVEHLATSSSYSKGWTVETITFELSGPTSGILSLGYTSTNSGSGRMPHIYIDGITISNGTDTWPKAPVEVFYTIKFVDNEGNELLSEQVKEGETVTTIPTAPEIEGYTFDTWEPEVTVANADATYKPVYTINTYNMIYLVDNEEFSKIEYEYNSPITPLEAPEKEGYTFSGWSEIPSTMPSSGVTVVGHFLKNSYSLIYLLDGEPYKEFTLEYESPITPLEAPEKENYIFDGWSEIPTLMPAHDVTVTGTMTYVEPDAIASLIAKGGVKAIYSSTGVPQNTLMKGLNIVVMSDGSIRKVMIK